MNPHPQPSPILGATLEAKDPKGTAQLLLTELIGFSREAKFAVEQENWTYLGEVLKKKDAHLALLQSLTTGDNLKAWGLGDLAKELQVAELAACGAIESKLTEARQKQAELDIAKNRASNVRQIVKMQTTEAGSWAANA